LFANVLNDVLEYFFADHIVHFLHKYKDMESSRRYSNHSTQLFYADMSGNLDGVNFSSLNPHCGKNGGSNVVAKYMFSHAEGLGRLWSNRVHHFIPYFSVAIGTSQYPQVAMYLYFCHARSDLLIAFKYLVARRKYRRQFGRAALNDWCCQVSMPSIMPG
jgi:hypothetical protein